MISKSRVVRGGSGLGRGLAAGLAGGQWPRVDDLDGLSGGRFGLRQEGHWGQGLPGLVRGGGRGRETWNNTYPTLLGFHKCAGVTRSG